MQDFGFGLNIDQVAFDSPGQPLCRNSEIFDNSCQLNLSKSLTPAKPIPANNFGLLQILRTAALLIPLLVMLSAGSAWAVQDHGGSEGLVSHELGHLLLILGMGYLLYHLRQLGQKGHNWREFRFFLWMLILWNLLTFVGHWLNEFVPAERFILNAGAVSAFRITDFADGLYYLSRLDHLFLLPAILCLLLALRRWSRVS